MSTSGKSADPSLCRGIMVRLSFTPRPPSCSCLDLRPLRRPSPIAVPWLCARHFPSHSSPALDVPPRTLACPDRPTHVRGWERVASSPPPIRRLVIPHCCCSRSARTEMMPFRGELDGLDAYYGRACSGPASRYPPSSQHGSADPRLCDAIG